MADKWKKGSCSECGKENVWVKIWAGEEICFECHVTEIRVMIQQAIKEEGLKAAQIQWEHVKSQIKRGIEKSKKQDPQAEKLGNKLIEIIDNDLYQTKNDFHPNKKGNRNWFIVGGIVVGVLILVGIVYWWWKSKEKT